MVTMGEPEKKKQKGKQSQSDLLDTFSEKESVEQPQIAEPVDPRPRVSPRVKAAQQPVAAPVLAAQAPTLATVRLEVFCRLTGQKWDRLAGFKFWARKQGLGPLPIAGWRAELEKFQKRPVG